MLSANYLLVNLIGFAVALVMLWVIRERTGEWLTFAHIFSFLWGANLIVSQLVLDGLLRTEIETLMILYAAWWLFLIGPIIIIKRPIIGKQPIMALNKIPAIAILIILVVGQLIAFIYEMVAIGINPIDYFRDYFWLGSELRISNIYSTIKYPFSLSIWRWDHVLYVPLALFLHFKRAISSKVLASVFLLSFFLSWGKFTRAPFIQLAVTSFIAWIVIYRPPPRIRYIVGSLVASTLVLGFVLTQYSLGKQTNLFSRILPTQSLYGYIGASPMAYETLLRGYFPRAESGYYSLESVNYILFKLSLIDTYPGLDRPYAAMPYETNVYTFLDVFTLDKGVGFALIGSFLTGALVAWVYFKMRLRRTYAHITIYSYLAYCCAMAIANNEFIRISVPINIILAIIINFLISRRGKAC